MGEKSEPIALSAAMKKRWLLVSFIIVVALALAFAYEKVKQPEYRAVTRILMSQSDQPSAGGLGAIVATQADPIRILAGMLESKRARDEARKVSGFKKDKDLKYNVRVEVPAGQIIVTMTDKNKNRELNVLNNLIENLKAMEGELGVTVATKEAENLLVAKQQREEEVKKIEDEILKFSEQAKTAPDPEKPLSAMAYIKQYEEAKLELKSVELQVQALHDSTARLLSNSENLPVTIDEDITRWRRTLDMAVYELNLSKITLGDRAPEVLRKTKAVEVARQRLQEQVAKAIQAANDDLSPEAAVLVSKKLVLDSQIEMLEPLAQAAPKEAMTYQRLLTRLTRAQGALELSSQKYESTKLKADAARVRWSVLDQPYIEEEPSNKNMIFSLIAGFTIGGIIAAGLCFMLEGMALKKATAKKPRMATGGEIGRDLPV